VLTLIAKEPDAINLKKFRPISLNNYDFKIFTKAMNNKPIKIIDRLVALKQTAFVHRR
jgi:hypothetical protein